MGKPTLRRSHKPASRKPAHLLIVAAQSEDALGLILRKAFRGVRFSSELAASEISPDDLAVGIFECGDYQGPREFATSARAALISSLCVQLRENETLIGPLAMPGRAGCQQCAFERMAAASAEATGTVGTSPAREFPRVTGSVLVRELRAIIRKGAASSQLIDHVLVVDAESLYESLHRLIPLPRCSVCGGAAAFPQAAQQNFQLTAEDSPETVLDALAGWIDLRTGVISGVFLEPPIDTAPGLPFIVTAAPPHILENGSLRRLPLGWGKGLSVSGAVLSAVGEAIERYSASLPDSERISWQRPGEIDGEFLDPRVLAPYTDGQYERDGFPYVRFDPSVRHPWVLGKWLGSDAPVWLPAVLVFLSLNVMAEHVICQGTSTGLAAWTDAEGAALRATFELIERDSFMSAWLTACPGKRVELDDSLDPALRRVLDGVEALGATVELYILPTSACGTAVLCLGLGDGDRYPGVTIGLGADMDPRLALRQAVFELGQTGPYLQRMMRSNQLRAPSDASFVREMLDHASYYFPRERAAAFDRLRKGGAPIALRDLESGASERSLANCALELKKAGIRVALVDVTSADVATGPFSVWRAISPDLQPISYGYGLETRPVERIRKLGLAREIPPIQPIW